MHAYLVSFLRLKEANFMHFKTGVVDDKTWADYRSSITDGPIGSTAEAPIIRKLNLPKPGFNPAMDDNSKLAVA
jgi:hypothetical protein